MEFEKTGLIEKVGFAAMVVGLLVALVLVLGPLLVAGIRHQVCVLPKVWNGATLGKAITDC